MSESKRECREPEPESSESSTYYSELDVATTPSSPVPAPVVRSETTKLVLPTAVRVVSEVAKPYPSHLRPIFQDPDMRRVHRLPWLSDYHPEYADIADADDRYPCRLFDCSALSASLEGEDHDRCSIDLYFYSRFITSAGDSEQYSSPNDHLRAWNKFVRAFNQDSAQWIMRLRKDEESFFKRNSGRALMIKIHCICACNNWACAVDLRYSCPMCYKTSEKLTISLGTTSLYPDMLTDALALLHSVMQTDVAHLKQELYELKGNERKRDRRIAEIEKSLRSFVQSPKSKK